LGDTTHGGLLSVMWLLYLHHGKRPPLLPGEPNRRFHKSLRLIYMAFGSDPFLCSEVEAIFEIV
jgi:hypothetical protein